MADPNSTTPHPVQNPNQLLREAAEAIYALIQLLEVRIEGPTTFASLPPDPAEEARTIQQARLTVKRIGEAVRG